MEVRHLVSIVVIAVLAGLRMALVMFPAPTSATLRNYDSMSRMSVIVIAATVVLAVMTCFALVILKQQRIRSLFSCSEAKSKRREAAKKKQQLQRGMAVVVLIVLLVSVGIGLVMLSSSIHDDPQTPSPRLSQDHEDGSSVILAIAAGSAGAGAVILAGAYLLMRQTSRASEMQGRNRKRRRHVRAQSS